MKWLKDKLEKTYQKHLERRRVEQAGEDPAGWCTMCKLPWDQCKCFGSKKGKTNG